MRRILLLLVLVQLATLPLLAQAPALSSQIRINQVGFYPNTPKAGIGGDAPATVPMAIYDALGREVARPLNAVTLPAGVHTERLAASGLTNGV